VSRLEREQEVATLTKRFSESNGAIVMDYKGLNVEKITGLRQQVREAGSEIKVAKNTLLKIATKDTEYEALHESFSGQTAVAFIEGDPAQLAKVLTKFNKEVRKENPETTFELKSGVLENSVLGIDEINQLGDLPSREVLLSQMLGVLSSPMTGLVSVLSDIPRKFLRVLTAVADQKE
jgi:large subunit ribosomal protein L10